jgi:NAD(P)H dehydrogenase (quinone)
MRTLIVLAHPEAKSFNAQLKDVAVETLEDAGHRVEVSDLYALGFDPVEGPEHFTDMKDPDWFSAQTEQRHAWEQGTTSAEVRAEIDKLERADFLLFQYPMWWYTVPAILKGWLDRVLVYGGLYTSRMRYDQGYFTGRRAMISVTTGGPEATFAHNGRNGDIDLLLWPMNFTLHYMGYGVLPPFVAYGIEGGLKYSDPDSIPARLQGYKEALAARLGALEEAEPLKFNGWDDWDEDGRLKPGLPGYSPFMRAQPRAAPRREGR